MTVLHGSQKVAGFLVIVKHIRQLSFAILAAAVVCHDDLCSDCPLTVGIDLMLVL